MEIILFFVLGLSIIAVIYIKYGVGKEVHEKLFSAEYGWIGGISEYDFVLKGDLDEYERCEEWKNGKLIKRKVLHPKVDSISKLYKKI